MTPEELPDLFGRVTLVLGEHATLRATVATLRMHTSSTDASGPPSPDLLAAVKDFTEQVRAHFAVEERAEYFGALGDESPELLEPIAALKAEHREMETLIGELEAAAATTVETKTLVPLLAQVLDRFVAHERREAELLDSFFRGHAPRTS